MRQRRLPLEPIAKASVISCCCSCPLPAWLYACVSQSERAGAHVRECVGACLRVHVSHKAATRHTICRSVCTRHLMACTLRACAHTTLRPGAATPRGAGKKAAPADKVAPAAVPVPAPATAPAQPPQGKLSKKQKAAAAAAAAAAAGTSGAAGGASAAQQKAQAEQEELDEFQFGLSLFTANLPPAPAAVAAKSAAPAAPPAPAAAGAVLALMLSCSALSIALSRTPSLALARSLSLARSLARSVTLTRPPFSFFLSIYFTPHTRARACTH